MKTEKQLARAYGELAQRLTGKRFLTASGLTRKEAAALLNREVWLEKLGRVLPIRRRVLCADVLELCRPEMERLAGSEQPEKGWLVYIYGTTSTDQNSKNWVATKSGENFTVPSGSLAIAENVGYDGIVVHVYIWMEGTDADCVNGKSIEDDTSKYDVTVKFAGVATTTP